MKLTLFALLSALFLPLAFAQDAASRLVYADFEQLDKDNRPLSARSGKILFESNAQNPAGKPVIAPKMLGAQAPLTQRIGFEFNIPEPNAWAEASMKIVGLKDKGYLDDWAHTLIVKSEDMSSYSALSLEIGAAGISQVRVRLISEGNGVDAGGAFPEILLPVNNQLQPYRVPLADFKQPVGDWVKKKVTTERVVKKLTAIQISVTQAPSKGFVVIDNVAFEK